MKKISKKDLIIALGESVKLQTHYASLLNMYDKGERIEFENVDKWLERLNYLGKIKYV